MQYSLTNSQGVVVRKKNMPMLPEDVRDNWSDITDFTKFDNPQSMAGELR